MKFKLSKTNINEIIKQINGVVIENSLNPIFTHLLVKTNSSNNEVCFTFANGKVAIQKIIPNVLIDDDFTFCLKAKIFTGIVSKLNADEICFEKIDSTLNISTSNFESNINLVDVSLFPEFIFDEYRVANKILTVNEDILSAIYKYTSSTVAQVNELSGMTILSGIHIKADEQLVHVISTDSFRASYYTFPNIEHKVFEFVIEPSILKNVIDITSNKVVDIYLKDYCLYFVAENTIILNKMLLIDSYPNIYNHFNKENISQFSIKNKDLIEMLEHGISLVQNDKTPIAKMSIDENKVEIRYQSIDFGSSYESAKWNTFNGVNIAFNINTKYLMSILKIYEQDDILYFYLTENNPIIIKKENSEDLKHLVLPLRS